jgi:hypothetical protein
MKDHVPFKDYDMSVSPHIRSLIETQLDRSGLTPSTPFGFASIHHVLRTTKEAPLKPNVRWSPNLDDEATQKSGRIEVESPSDDITSGLRMGQSLHPVATQILRKRLIDHGDQITDPEELHKHLFALSHTFKEYRKRLQPSLSDLQAVDEEHRHHINPIPQKEQFQISNQIMRLMTHPDFHDANPKKELTPTNMRDLLSVSHNESSSGGISRNTDIREPTSLEFNKKPLFNLFSDTLTDPHVRHHFHNFLDSYESRGASHQQLSAAIRGHMIYSPHMNGEERIRMLKKYAFDPSSIDVGNVGSYYVPVGGDKPHPMTGLRHRNDPAIEEFKKTDRALWGKSYWNSVPAFPDLTHKRIQHLLLKDISAARFKKQELVDMLGHAHHLLTTHPTFTQHEDARRNVDQFGNQQPPSEIFHHHVDQLHRSIGKFDLHTRSWQTSSLDTAKDLILSRSKMIASGVAK